MRIDVIEVHNHLSHGSTRVEFNGTRLAAFTGPNGAGKSSLLESIKWVLFDDARARGDELVRLGETDMSASITFGYAGATYRATRGRSTKAGGRSYLELAVQAPDGSWTPLTEGDIRATQARIAELLGLDAESFGTAVFLAQGRANRFAELTAGDRKRVLGQVLGLEVYEKAEARARELAREVDARLVGHRDQLQRLVATLASRPEREADLEYSRGTLAGAETEYSEAAGAVDVVGTRIRELDTELAAAAAVTEQLAALEADRARVADEWRRAQGRATAARDAAAGAERVIAGAADVDAAVAALPGAKAELEALVAAEAADRGIRQDLERRRAEIRGMESAYSEAVSTHRATYESARRRVDELTLAVQELEPVICEKCQHPNVVDQAGIRPHLEAARREFNALEKSGPPKAPAGLLTEQAAIDGAERRRAEAGFDAARLATLHAEVTRLSSTAARSEAIAAARQALEQATAAVTEAEVDKAAAAGRGQAISEAIQVAQAKSGPVAELHQARAGAEEALRVARARVTEAEGHRRIAEKSVAVSEAALEQLVDVQTEADLVAQGVAAGDDELGRLRRLVAAFGVTGIPARIIEGVLPELASYANELLGELRPGMTLELRAQRAKKSGAGVVEALDLVVRDAAGERPLALFSGGERMSVSLALAVGLSRLVARRAGSRIESLVIDEPDGLDAAARRAFGQALRVIAHRGDLARVVLVSHHDDLAEFGDATYQVTKGPQGSVVELVA